MKRVTTWSITGLLQLSALALVAGVTIRMAGEFEGLRPTGGSAPILASTASFAILWFWLLRIVRPWLYRFAVGIAIVAVVAVAAGAIWTVYTVVPGSIAAAVVLIIITAIRR